MTARFFLRQFKGISSSCKNYRNRTKKVWDESGRFHYRIDGSYEEYDRGNESRASATNTKLEHVLMYQTAKLFIEDDFILLGAGVVLLGLTIHLMMPWTL